MAKLHKRANQIQSQIWFYLIERIGRAGNPRETNPRDGSGADVRPDDRGTNEAYIAIRDSPSIVRGDKGRKKLASRRQQEKERSGKRIGLEVESDERAISSSFTLFPLPSPPSSLRRLFNRVHSCSLRASTERHATLSLWKSRLFGMGRRPPSCSDNC